IIPALQQAGKTVQVLYGDYSFSDQEPRVRTYLSQPAQIPQLIVGLNGIITLGAMAICHQLQLSLSFFSVDKPPYADAYGLHIPGVYHNTQLLGEKAAQILFHSIETPAPVQLRREVVSGVLVE
ncbi:MAG: LacI family DNA-binding transcriptional regulator, partial [Enterobacteriaceae bacterium]